MRASVGSEWVSDLSLFYLANIRLIVGLAHGFDAGGENQFYGTLEGTALGAVDDEAAGIAGSRGPRPARSRP